MDPYVLSGPSFAEQYSSLLEDRNSDIDLLEIDHLEVR